MRGFANNDRPAGTIRRGKRAAAAVSAVLAVLLLDPVPPALAGGNEDYSYRPAPGQAPSAAAPAYRGGSTAQARPLYAGGGSDPVMDALGMQTIVIGGSTPSGVDVDMSVLDDLGGTLPPSAPRVPTGLHPPGGRRMAAPAAPATPKPARPQVDAGLVPPPPPPERPAPPVPAAPPPAPPAEAPPAAPSPPVAAAPQPQRPRTIAMVELGTRLTDAGEAPLPSPAPIPSAPETADLPVAPPAQVAVAEPPPPEPAPVVAEPPAESPPAAPIQAAPPAESPPAESPVAESSVAEAPAAEAPGAAVPPQDAPPAEGPAVGDSGGRPMELAALPPPAPASGTLPPAATAVGTIRFDTTSDALTDNAKAALERIAEQLKAPDGRVLIRGFASGLNDTATGARRLALHRIQAVRTFLIEKGVPAGRIDLRAIGMAQDAPVADGVDISLLP